jgi:hypothetical protein
MKPVLRGYLNFVLVIAIVVSPLAGFTQNQEPPPPATAEERYTFLDALIERVDFILRMNLKNLEMARSCFLGTRVNKDCPKIQNRIKANIEAYHDRFKQHIFNSTLLYRTHMFLRLYVDQANEIQRGKPQRGRTLRQLFINDWVNPLSDVEGISHLPRVEFKPAEISRWLQDDELLISRTNKNNEEKYEQYAYNISGYLQMMCNEFHQSLQRAEGPGHRLVTEKSRPVCGNLVLQYDERFQMFYFPRPEFLHPGDQEFLERFRSMSEYIAAEENRHVRERFYRAVTKMPYVALVPSSRPSNQEIADAFTVMISGASTELTEVIKLAKKAKTQGAGDFKSALSFFTYAPVVEDVIENPSFAMRELYEDTNFEAVAAELSMEYGTMELWRMAGELGLMIGLSSICFVPVTKIKLLATATRWFTHGSRAFWAEVACVGFAAVGVNYYFYSEAKELYQETFRRVFATQEGSVALAELKKLSDDEFGVVIEVLMFPMGVMTVKQLATISGKLSKGTWQYLQRHFAR